MAEPVEKKKRKKPKSFTPMALLHCKERGWPVERVERYNFFTKRRNDFFGFADLVVLVPGAILAVQVTGGEGGNHAARREKIRENPNARSWLDSGGRIAIWSFAKQGAAGKRKLWTMRVEAITNEE